MHSYKQQWRAKRGTWDALIENQERAKQEDERNEAWERYVRESYSWDPEYAEERIAEERAYRAEREIKAALRREKDRVLNGYLSSLTPKNDWVGAAWVDTNGNLYPVRYCNHTSRAEELAPHHFADEVERKRDRQGWIDCGEFLSDKGWLRIGADGLVGDHRWERVRDIPNAQFDAIWEMHRRGEARGAHDYRETERFVGGLLLSIRFAMGEVNEQGETPEEVAKREREYEHMRQHWARADAERQAAWERQPASSYAW